LLQANGWKHLAAAVGLLTHLGYLQATLGDTPLDESAT
jgi:hypothetical protein